MGTHSKPPRETLVRALGRVARIPWAAGALLALAIRLPTAGDEIAMDASAYLAGGFAWSQGELPYRDLFDHKGPLNAELFLALDWLLPTSAVLLRILLLAVFVGSMVQLTALLRRHVPGAAWPAVVVYAIAASSPLLQGQDLNTEQITLPLLIAATDVADRARSRPFSARGAELIAAAAGALIAAAAGLKSIYVLAAAPVPLILLARRPRLLAAAGAGAALAATAILLPFAAAGALDDMRSAVVDYSRAWAGGNWRALLDQGPRELLAYVTAFPSHVLPMLGLVLGAIALGDPHRRRVAACASAAAIGGWVAARAPGASFDHYFLLPVPGLAVLCGLGADALASRTPSARRAVLALVVAPILAALAISPLREVLAIPPDQRWGLYRSSALARQGEAADIIDTATKPGDRIYVITGGAYTNAGQAIYWESRRLPASRFIFPADVVPPAFDAVRADLARTRPAAIVVMPGAPMRPVAAAIDAGNLEEIAALESGDGLTTRIYARERSP